jgi:hypothetical protein
MVVVTTRAATPDWQVSRDRQPSRRGAVQGDPAIEITLHLDRIYAAQR